MWAAEVLRVPGPDLLSAGPYSEKNVGPFNWGGKPYFSWEKTATLFSHHRPWVSCQFSKTGDLFCSSLSFHSGIAHFSGIQKFAAPFVGAPVRPNMLNMRKCAADEAGLVVAFICRLA